MDIIQGDEIPMNPLGGGMDEVSHQLGESYHDMGYGLGRQMGESLINAGLGFAKAHPYIAGGLAGAGAIGVATALAPEMAGGALGAGALGLVGEEGADVATFLAGGAL
jgi:hypothetical protein